MQAISGLVLFRFLCLISGARDGKRLFFVSSGFPPAREWWGWGIPCVLASLVRVPLRFAKGRARGEPSARCRVLLRRASCRLGFSCGCIGHRLLGGIGRSLLLEGIL